MGQHTGLVLGHNGESDGIFGAIGEGGGGEVDTVFDCSGFEKVVNGFGGHGGGGAFGFFGGGSEVGEEDGVFVVPEEVIGEVTHVSGMIVGCARVRNDIEIMSGRKF